VLRGELEAAEQELCALIELAEVHIAEAQVVEEIGIVGILAEEFLQVDAGLVELAGGEELEGAGEGVGVGHGEISPGNGRGDLYYNRIPDWICDSDFSVVLSL
jgi:hypothetical protein